MSTRPSRLRRLGRFAPQLRGTQPADLPRDLAAGLTVAALAVPQALAYALVAGVPPELGLLAAAVPVMLAALFGSSPHLVSGPTSPVALVIGVSVVGPALAAGEPVPIAAVLWTAGMAGVAVLAFGLLGLGRAARFLSDSVLTGFATGAGLLIALGLLPQLGAAGTVGAAGHPLAPKLLALVRAGAHALADADTRSLGLAVCTPLLGLALQRLDPRVPGALLALAAATLLGAALGWTAGPNALATLGAIPAGFPALAMPGAADPRALAAPALAIALLTILQSVAAARSVRPPGFRLDADREIVGQGVANVAAAFTGALPVCGSLTRSALARAAGGRTRLTSLVSGAAVAALLPFLAPALARVPHAALVGLVVLSGLQLINPRAILRASGTRGDALVLVVTLVATLWIDLLQALYAGVILSLLLLVRRAGRLQMVEFVRAGERGFRELPLDARTGTTPAVILHLEGDLSFAVATELTDRLGEIAERGPRVLLLRLKRARHLDATVAEALREQVVSLRAQGIALVLFGLGDELAEQLARTELGEALGPDGLLRTRRRLFEGFEHALDHARRILAPLDDSDIFRTEDTSVWSYEV